MSNRLPVLAEEIRRAHTGVLDAAKTAADRAIEAGNALIEAKKLLKHGQWLPWLKEHCQLSERSAQLYMRIANLGLKSETVAEFGLNAAAKTLGVIETPNYDPFAHCSEEERRSWELFARFLCQEFGLKPESVGDHIEWIVRRPFTSVAEWLGPDGAQFRKSQGMREPDVSKSWEQFKTARPIGT